MQLVDHRPLHEHERDQFLAGELGGIGGDNQTNHQLKIQSPSECVQVWVSMFAEMTRGRVVRRSRW